MEHLHPTLFSLDGTRPNLEESSDTQIELAEKHRKSLEDRRKLLKQCKDPFSRLEVMWVNNMRAMRDPYDEQLAYYQELEKRELEEKKFLIR